MTTIAVCSRVLQFRAGPNESRFYACEQHRADLERGDYDGLFFGVVSDEMRPEDPDDEQPCDYCREG